MTDNEEIVDPMHDDIHLVSSDNNPPTDSDDKEFVDASMDAPNLFNDT